MGVTDVKQSPRRGRPPQTAEEAEQVRARIIGATADVFAKHGSRGLSVALILDGAGISRPTFYRYFANAEEPLNVLLEESDRALVAGLTKAIEAAGDDVAMAISVIDAYIDWAHARGPLLGPLFSELYDRSSPVSAHRTKAIDDIRTIVVRRIVELGRDAPNPLDLDALLNACEFLVYRVVALGGSADVTADARSTMIRIAIVTLGKPDDVRMALEIPGVF
ncbi:TetR/AcrR family transcriptional regulator [Antrihabitans cavernicola]|uniref:TetR/AcrR family transcriptional regulator n=1 Tax=Antrihabitans cavernicola TaxID=2495913 RepID=A0A5A7S7N6_9NOCA|nr:TetR/AcrR family transcriptional regulator [Spelaeibacter cavernicola]KAA0021209.1 TetR/AcrR family transcriptional regulator [Spelaeibacter cavernicola]